MGKPFWRSVEYFFTGNYSADDGNNDIVAIGFGGEIHAYGGDDHIHLGSIGATVYTGSGNDTVSAGAGYLKVEDTTGNLSVRGAAGYADIKKNGDGNLSFSGAAGGVDIGHDGQHGNISYAGAAAYNHIKRQGSSGHVSFQGAGGYNAIWHETNHGNLSFEGAGAGNKIDRTWFNQYQGSQGDVRFVGAGVANSISSRVESGNLHFSGAGADNHLVRKGKVGDITLEGAGASNRIERTHNANDVYTETRGNIRFEGVGGYNSLYSDVAHGDIHFSGGGAYNTITRKGSGGDFDAQGMEYAKADEIVLTTAQMHGLSIDNGNKFHAVNAVKSEREPNTYLFAIADGNYTKINKIRLYNDAESGKLKYYSEAWFKQGNHLTDLAHSDVSFSGGFESNPVNGGYTLSNIAIEHQQSVTVHAVEKSLTEYEWVTYANGVVIDAKDVSLSDAKMGGHAIFADGTKVDVKAVKSNRKPNTYVYAKMLGQHTKIVVVELANDAETGALKYQARSWYKEGDHTANLANQDISSAYGYHAMGKGGYSLSDLHYSVNAIRSTSETVADIDEYTDQTLFKPVSDSGESSGDIHFNGVGGGNVIKSNVTRGHVYFNGGGLANVILHSSQFGNTEFNGAGAANVIVKSGEEGDLTFRGAGLANVLVHQSQQGKMDVYAGGALNVLVRVGNGDYLARLLAYGNISVQKGQGNSRVTLLGGYNTHTQIGSGDALWLAAGGFNVMTQVGQGDVASVLAGGANVLTKMGDGELTAGMLGGANVITHISSDDQLSNTTAVALGGANILTKKGKGNTLAVMGGGANVLTHVGDGTTTGVMVGGANILTKVGNGDTTGIMLGVGNVLTHVGDGQTLGVMGAAGNIFTKVGDGTSISVMIGAGNIFTHVGEGNAWALMGGLGNVFTKVGNGDALALMVAEANVFTHIGDGMSVALMLAKGNIATKVGNGTTLAAMVGNANIFTHVGSGSTFAAMIGQANIMTKVGDDLTAALMVGKANIYTHVGDGTSLGIFAGEVNVMTKVGNGTTLAAMFGKANIMTHVGDGLTGVLALGEANIVTKVGDDFMGVVAAAKANVVTHVGDATTAAVLAGKGNILTKVGEGTTVGLLISDIGNVMTHVGDGTTIGIAKGKANIITKVGDGLGVNVAWGQANVFTHVGDGDRYNFAKGEANVISKVGDGQEVSVVQGQANIITHVGDGDDYTGAWGKANVITKVGNGRNVVLAKGEANIVTQVGDGDSFNALWSKGNIVTKVGDGMQVTAAKGKANVTTRVGDGLNVTAAYGDANINTVVGDGISVNVAWGQYNVNTKIGDGLNVAVMKGKANANIHVGDGLGVNASYAQNNVAIKIGNGDFYSLAVASSNTSSNKLSALFDNIKQTVLGVGGSQAINYLVQGDEASSSGTHKGRGAIATPEITKLDGFQMEAIEEVGSDLGDSLTGSVTKVDAPDLNQMQNALSVDDSSDQVQGPNLIVNGDFEQGEYGWRASNGIEAGFSANGYGVASEGHGNRVSELDTYINTTIFQDLNDLNHGEVITLSFDFAKRAGISNNEGIDVLWNGEVVFSSSGDESAWQKKTLKLTAQAGSNRIEFKGTGHDDGLGYILDNVVAKLETLQQTNAVSEHATQNQASQNALSDKERAEADRQRLEQEKQKQLDAVAGSQSQLESTDQQALENNGQAQRDAVKEESEAVTAELTELAQGLDVLDDRATHTGESGDQWRNNFAGGLLDGVQTQLDNAKQVSGEQIAAAKQTHADNQNKVKDSVAQSEAGVAKGEQNLAGAEQGIADAKTDAEKRKADALAKGNDAKEAESDAHSAANDAQSRGDRDAMNAEHKANQVQNDAKGAKQNESDRPDRQGVAGSGLVGQAHSVEAAGAAGRHINADSQTNADGRFSEGLSEQELEALEGATNAVNRLQINAGIRAKNTGSSVTSMFTETNADSIVVPTTASQDVSCQEIHISRGDLEGLGEVSSHTVMDGNAIDNMLRDSLPFYSLRAERNLLVQEGDEGLEVRAWPGTDDNSKIIVLDDPEDAAQQKAIERFILANFDNFEQMPDELFLVDNKVISHHEGRTRVLAQKEEGAWKYNTKAELMSVTELLDAASVTGKIRGESYQQVIDALAEYNLSTFEHADYELESVEKLVNLCKQIEGYVLGHPDSGRVETMKSLLNQVNSRLEAVSVLAVSDQSIKDHDSFSRLYDQLDNANLKNKQYLDTDSPQSAERALESLGEGKQTTLDLSSVSTKDELKNEAKVFAKPIGESYQKILDQLDLLHTTQGDKQIEAALRLNNLVDDYVSHHEKSGRNTALLSLKNRVSESLYNNVAEETRVEIAKLSATRIDLAADLLHRLHSSTNKVSSVVDIKHLADGTKYSSQESLAVLSKQEVPFNKELQDQQLVQGRETGEAVVNNVQLSDDEIKGIKWYTSEGFQYVNEALRKEDKLTYFVKDNAVNAVNAVKGLNKLETFEGTVYRAFMPGVSLNDLASQVTPGQLFSDQGFTSTSTSTELAKSFRGGKDTVILTILDAKGTNVAGLAQLNQAEVLLKPGAHLRIEAVKETDQNLHIVAKYTEEFHAGETVRNLFDGKTIGIAINRNTSTINESVITSFDHDEITTLLKNKPVLDDAETISNADSHHKNYQSRDLVLEPIVQPETIELGMPDIDQKILAEVAERENVIIGVRPVDEKSKSLIDSKLYSSKGLFVKAKSSDWGPMSGFIPVDQSFAKASARRDLNKFNGYAEQSIESGNAVSADLYLNQVRMDELVSKYQSLTALEFDAESGMYKTTATNGDQTVTFFLNKVTVESKDLWQVHYMKDGELAPFKVIGDPVSKQPMTADYDLLTVMYSYADLGPQDKVKQPLTWEQWKESVTYEDLTPKYQELYDSEVLYNKKDGASLGVVSDRLKTLKDVINTSLGRTDGLEMVHHGADDANPYAVMADNFPATFFVPKSFFMEDGLGEGKGSIQTYFNVNEQGAVVIRDPQEFSNFQQVAINVSYRASLNDKWNAGLDDQLFTPKRKLSHEFLVARDKIAKMLSNESSDLGNDSELEGIAERRTVGSVINHNEAREGEQGSKVVHTIDTLPSSEILDQVIRDLNKSSTLMSETNFYDPKKFESDSVRVKVEWKQTLTNINNIRSMYFPHDMARYFEALKDYKVGNCGDRALYAAHFIMDKYNFQGEVELLKLKGSGDHVFVRVGGTSDSAKIIDPWTGQHFAHSQIKTFLYNPKEKKVEVHRSFDNLKALFKNLHLTSLNSLTKVQNHNVENWENVVVIPIADGGETRFDGQVIVQMENDSVVAKAAANLAGKHPENSVVVQLDSEGNYRVVYGDPSKLDGKLRWQLVGHGRDDSEHNNTRLSGYSADELAVKLAKFQQAFGQAENISNKPDHISIVGCSLVSDDKQKGFGHQFINAMDANGLRVDVSVRNSDVAVDTTGRKHTQDANGNWVKKAANNKVSLTWNTQGEVTVRDEIIRNGVAEGDIHLSRVGASEVNEPARGAIGDNSEVFEAPEKRKTETDTTASAGSDNKLSYSGNIQVNVGDGEFTAVNWGTSNVGIKVGTGGFKSLAFGDNNVMVHIGNGDSKHSVDIAGYQALEGAQMFMGNRNVSFNMGRSNGLIVMMDKSIPTPPLVNPFDGASRISGVLQSIAQSGKGADWLTAQEQQWTLSGAKKFVKEMSGLDQTSSVDYTSLVDLDSQNERSSRGLKSDAEATLNKKYNQWLSGNSNNDTGKMSRADKFRQMNEKLAFNFAVGGQGADIQVTTGNWNFMFGDNIQAILDTNLGSLFGVLTQQFSATGMAQTTFTYNPQDLPRQLKNKLLGKFAEVGAETTLGDIFGVNYTADGKIVSRTDEAVDGVAILKEMLEVIGEFGGEQLSAFTDPEKLLDSLKAGIDMGADGLQSFAESHGLKEKAPEENDTAQVTLNGAPAATENVSATVEETKPERAFGFNALNFPNLFATMFSKDKQTEMASLVSNLKQNLTADLLNMKDKTFDFLRNSGHLQGDGDMNVSLGNYNFNWGGDGKDLGAYLGDNNNFWGGRGDDVFYATGVSNIFTGGEGHDMGVLMGRENMMFGGDGNDTAVVAGRINHVFMGAGDDQSFVFGEGGEITMGSGNDYAVTSGNFNRVDMGDDQDFAVTIGNNNQLDLGAGNDFARVFGNHNRIDAGQGNDEVKLMGYHASINAGEGEDYLIAAAISKFSTLNGGEGNDVMVLGGYQNTFKGGAGVDSFVVSGEVIDNVVEDIRQGENIIFNGIDWNRLWFERSGYDLKISMARHTDTSSDQTLFDALGCVTFNDYFANNRAKLIIGLGEKDAQGEQEYTCLTDNALDNLIQAMSSFAPKVGESNFMDGLASQPQQAIMAAWSDVNTGKFSLS
ncbi:MARTX multifunctional-autoprocessing repeats-in-toxin holotoxin RtxA [Vibrio anguillarum]|nr:MARTX multifunctional-autoprocessing repeats-in-toxin holotoxin RtxA [Vibrio anguillarum]MBT3019076.1 MARTX multifunctional-autoprocessing repeats-in-toxin holotoxin RtxA [Vibrio anguillarum]MBT9964939.1 MARTX multifunctional-autoprocessing repeats-in-toxin holotoxin RtxA [Vibrio anguillarum]MBT9979103.1 MARTX multifunctional-autoprocessing repeats-in-toxin holotoxin RtxA [Vibrio anguillarum]MBT9982607.1 MARTX multifunctional-autoprocessing repeats-in-toxin holotoxin RtxA [Vibrio anguillarum